MHIDVDAKIAGLPALELRHFFRRELQSWWNAEALEEALRISSSQADAAVQELFRLGLIRPGSDVLQGYWYLTTKGSALAMASAAKPLHRKTAEKKLNELLVRVSQINEDAYYLYKVIRVGVFGSYLTGQERINDIDIAIELAPKEPDPEVHARLCDGRIKKAMADGRVFGNISQEMTWPQMEVWRFLKHRSRSLSLHDFRDSIPRSAKTVILFDKG